MMKVLGGVAGLGLSLAIVAACSSGDEIDPRHFEEGQGSSLSKGTPGAQNGDVDYCTGGDVCLLGEGDCEYDSECAPGLVCGWDNGPNFGMPPAWDVCVPPSCRNQIQDGDETGVDCGSAECGACTVDVCPSEPNHRANTCDTVCPCPQGWGDCDSDSECQGALICLEGNGEQFDSHPAFAYCVPEHCGNGQQDAASGETGVDCGGPCGKCVYGSTEPSSCEGGLDICGAAGNENCCASPGVPVVTYHRNYDGVLFTDPTDKSAWLAKFHLDRFEVTVGRFRRFVSVYDAWLGAGNPAVGAGKHPFIADSGWQNGNTLPADAAELTSSLNCGDPTWTATPGTNEALPINCVDWSTAFAFCIWDKGRLPTEAEWNAAAAGGEQQRVYPWSSPPTSTTLTATQALYNFTTLERVGSKPAGAGRWGQMDLAGSMWEWTLDYYVNPLPAPCTNCANLASNVQNWRVIRGGSYVTSTPANLAAGFRTFVGGASRQIHVGFRCARN